MRINVFMTMMAVAVLGLTLVACGPKKGTAGNRVEIYETTDADRNSDKMRLPDLTVSTDKTAQDLARDLADIREIKNSPTKVVLELGSIENRTRSTPSSDFKMMQRRLRGFLMRSNIVRDQFIIVERADRMEAEYNRVNLEEGGNLLGDGADRNTSKYDKNITYVLQGDFFEAPRGSKSQYYWEFKLVNLGSRSIVFSSSYDLAVRR